LILGKTSVKFAPTAFVDPYEYLDSEETKTTVDRYELYMLGRESSLDTYFKVSVVDVLLMVLIDT